MFEGPNGIEVEVFESRTFTKALNKLSDDVLKVVEDEIDKVIDDPDIGTRKKGDLNYLWVHKFKIEGHEILLGYSWNEGKLELHLLNVGPHENFYQAMKKRRKADLKIIGK